MHVHNANHRHNPVCGHVDQSLQLVQSMQRIRRKWNVERNVRILRITGDFVWGLWKAGIERDRNKGEVVEKHEGVVFVCELIREKDLQKLNSDSIVITRV